MVSLTKEAEYVLWTSLGTYIYRIDKHKYLGCKGYDNTIEKIQITEISRKRDRSGKDLGWAFIANGTRYKISGLGKTWFWTKEDAEKYLLNKLFKDNDNGNK